MTKSLTVILKPYTNTLAIGKKRTAEARMINFEFAYIFYALPLPLLGLLLPRPKLKSDAIRVPFYNAIVNLQQSKKYNQSVQQIWLYYYYGLLALIWALLLLAMARPIWVGEPITLQTSGRDLLLAVDISGSMQEQDMQDGSRMISRMQALKNVVEQFIEQRKGDRIGLILFGEQAYMQTPLTLDVTTVSKQLGEARIGFAGRTTAIGDAIGLAVKRLLARNANNESDKVIILLTDGSNTAGTDPLLSAQIAAEEEVTIYTIGIGAEVIARRSFFGTRQIQNTEIDEVTLRSISDLTGGQYYRARNATELSNIYDVIEQLEEIPESTIYRPQIQIFFYPLIASVLLSMLLLVSIIVKRRYV